MHTHVSLFEGDRNAFFEAGAEYQLSTTGPQSSSQACSTTPPRSPGHQPVGQLTQAAASVAARLPPHITWGHNNRSAMIRVPMYKPNKGQSTRVELRTIDPACNPYLAFAVTLAAGMKGIEEGYDLPREAEDERARPTERERKSLGHPTAAQEPVGCHRRRAESELLAETLGEHVFDFFLRSSCSSGRSTAPRSPPSSAIGCCRSCERTARAGRRAPGLLPSGARRRVASRGGMRPRDLPPRPRRRAAQPAAVRRGAGAGP